MLTKQKNKFLEITYLTSLFLYISISIFTISMMKQFIDRFINHNTLGVMTNWIIAGVLVIVYLLKPHKNFKYMLCELFVGALFIIATYTNQNTDNLLLINQCTMFFVIGLFMINADLTTFKRISITSLAASVFVFISNFSLSQIGLITDNKVDRFGTWAHGYGYYYYAQPSYYMLFIWLTYMFVRGKKELSWAELIAEYGFMYLIYVKTTCRLGFVCATFAFIMYIIVVKLNLIRLDWKITRFGSIIGFPAFAAFTLLTGYFYGCGNPLLVKFNTLINGRVEMVYEAFQRYNVNLFGRLIIPHDGGTYFFLDAGYSYELFGCGAIFYLTVLAMYSYMHYYSCKKNDKPLFILLTTLMIFGIVGDVWVGISYTSVILGFFITFKERKEILDFGKNKSAGNDSSK